MSIAEMAYSLSVTHHWQPEAVRNMLWADVVGLLIAHKRQSDEIKRK